MTSRRPSPLREFLASEAAGGVVLMAAAAVALVIANSGLSAGYFALLDTYVGPLSVLHWVNDALMAVFFLLVGLEIKREFISGQLASWPQRILPGAAAAGGMIAPALIYVALNAGTPENLRGWAIPTATDIAFALGVLALLGGRAPASLKVFLVALAIIDDLGAVAIIAAFYTAELSGLWLGAAAATLAALAGLNWAGVKRLMPYLVLGAGLRVVVLKSGVHATLAGVALALTIPIGKGAGSPLHRLEHALHGAVAFLVVPVFGLANAGVSFAGMSFASLLAPLPLGIALGLFAGKQIGVFGVAWLLIKLRWAEKPDGATLAQLYGVALICGIGFTMSLFIGLLAFPASQALQDAVKLGVLGGSLISALAGAAVLLLASTPSAHSRASGNPESKTPN
jgi:NhaA family Na+:H+ antiporter